MSTLERKENKMSFSKGLTPTEVLLVQQALEQNDYETVHALGLDPYRSTDLKTIHTCAYPSCHKKDIHRADDAVVWGGVAINIKEFTSLNLEPVEKLMVECNLEPYAERYGHFLNNMFFHAECAAEFGMHLVKDALGKGPIGSILRKSRGDNS
jgi:hypothetical protein